MMKWADKWFVVLVVGVVCRWGGCLWGAALSDALPQDTLAFAEFDAGIGAASSGAGGGAGQSAVIEMGLKALQSLGVLGKEAGVAGDVLGLAAEAGGRRNCVAWLDAELNATADGGLGCRSAQVVWMVETAQPAEMVERLTRLLAHFSTQATAEQAIKHTAEEKKEFVEFHDRRWPAWLTLAWAQQPAGGASGGEPGRFIVALGPGAMEHFLADRPVEESPWKPVVAGAEAEGAKRGVPGDGAVLARVFVSPKALRARFPEPVRRTVLGRLLTSVDLASADVCVLTARIKDRAVSLSTGTLDGGKVTVNPWTVALPAGAPLLRAVPEDATAYVVFNVQWVGLYERVVALCNAILNDPSDMPVEKTIADLAQKEGVDVRKDILERLQPWVLVHDSPRHPLRLPFMVTTLAAAEPGSGEKAKAALAKLTAAVERELARKAKDQRVEVEAPASGAGPSAAQVAGGDFARLRVRTDSDGVSYLQFGLVGPGWGWLDNRLIGSWSPGAVRANFPAAGRVTTEAFSPARP